MHLLRTEMHGAKLREPELSSVLADALLPKEHRAAVAELDEQRAHERDREQADEQRRGDHDLQQTLERQRVSRRASQITLG